MRLRHRFNWPIEGFPSLSEPYSPIATFLLVNESHIVSFSASLHPVSIDIFTSTVAAIGKSKVDLFGKSINPLQPITSSHSTSRGRLRQKKKVQPKEKFHTKKVHYQPRHWTKARRPLFFLPLFPLLHIATFVPRERITKTRLLENKSSFS